jgi:hypothetical protein
MQFPWIARSLQATRWRSMRPNQSFLLTTLIMLPSIAVFIVPAAEKLGQVQFPVTCSSAPQTRFNWAVALLPSWWYAAAVRGFAAVTEADPTCGMGDWGIVMGVCDPFCQLPSAAMLVREWSAIEQAIAVGGKTER